MQGNTDFDLVGIGFGPSNLALGVRLAEPRGVVRQTEMVQTDVLQAPVPLTPAMQASRHCFIERQPTFGWHKGMLLDDCRMQISFLKDLVTMRDPTSRFSFINYLFERGRLAEFINIKSFYPTRHEFHDYLAWAAQAIERRVHYGETVTEIRPVLGKRRTPQVVALDIVSHDSAGREWRRSTRALSLGLGGVPFIPALFQGLTSRQIIHSSRYLVEMDQILFHANDRKIPSRRMRIAVIGSGQSAAEVFVDLTRRYAYVDASLIMRAPALKPADESPFVNEIFDPAFTDVMYAQSPQKRRLLLDQFHDTNYAVVDKPLIDVIYSILYQQKVTACAPHQVRPNADIETVAIDENGSVVLTMQDSLYGNRYVECFDAVVLATGYRHDAHVNLLQPLAAYLDSDFPHQTAHRDYRLPTPDDFLPAIYLQGACEESHGLSDTLLSVLAIRADEIATSIEACWKRQVSEAIPIAPHAAAAAGDKHKTETVVSVYSQSAVRSA